MQQAFDPQSVRRALRRIVSEIRVELSEEFDRNFERQAFFSEAWQRRKSPSRRSGGATLIDTGTLRRSIRSIVKEDSITFTSTVPYAAIHNEGGEITVTARMKRYFWARHMAATGARRTRRDGSLRRDKRNARLSAEAEFWRAMALKKVGSRIRIPRRSFLGFHPEVERKVRGIIERAIAESLAE